MPGAMNNVEARGLFQMEGADEVFMISTYQAQSRVCMKASINQMLMRLRRCVGNKAYWHG